jgi:uncharacterized repeat protein (TIGR02543 family)
MNQAQNVTATFSLITYTVTVTQVGSGSVSSSPSGVSLSSAGRQSYGFVFGTPVTLTEVPAAGYVFSGWSGGACSGTQVTCTLTMNQAASVTATFSITTVNLNLSEIGNGAIKANSATVLSSAGSMTRSYTFGTPVTLTEVPATGYVFSGWSGGTCSGTQSTCTLTMNQAASVTATFSIMTVSLNLSQIGNGTVVANAVTILSSTGSTTQSYNYGTSVTLAEVPATGYTFTGWSGGACAGTRTTCTLKTNQALTVTATFTIANVNLNLSQVGHGTIAANTITVLSGAGSVTRSFTYGTSVTLTEVPATGYTFTGWSGGVCAGTQSTCSITVSQAATVMANFQLVNTAKALRSASGKHGVIASHLASRSEVSLGHPMAAAAVKVKEGRPGLQIQ